MNGTSARGATTATVLSLEQSSKAVDEVAHSLAALHQAAEQAALNIQQQVAAVGQVSAAMGSLAASAQETALLGASHFWVFFLRHPSSRATAADGQS